MAKAADAFSAGDLVNRRVRSTQNWSLAPFAAVMGTIFPATYMRGGRETFGLYPMEPNFPRRVLWAGLAGLERGELALLGGQRGAVGIGGWVRLPERNMLMAAHLL